MKHFIDSILDKTTMYRLTLYVLMAIIGVAFVESIFGVLSITPIGLVSTTAELLLVCWLTNLLASKIFRITPNKESAIITALILALIVDPVWIISDPARAGLLALTGVIAIASKFLFLPKRQHIFNPAAFGVFASGLLFHGYSAWWVGSAPLLPVVLIGGLLILRKTVRFRMAGIFLVSLLVFQIAFSLLHGQDISMTLLSLKFIVFQTELFFFASVMLTEPLTSPKTFRWRAVYAVIVAFFFLPQLVIFGINFSPELALLIGNLFSYLTAPGYKLVLALKEKREIGTDMISFTFDFPKQFRHRAGQYMEWTLPLNGSSDSRGNRRYFTIASAPTEGQLEIAARFYDHPSAYKQAMSKLKRGDTIVAADLSGDFVLPKDPEIPLAFIAGGIGITPFRSMIRQMMDSGEKRSVVLFYSNYGPDEIVYGDVFNEAAKSIGLKTVYTLTDCERTPADWCGKRGFIDARMIAAEVPDYADRMFYVSGSLGLVEQMRKHLTTLGVRPRMIKTDFFPGYVS